ncbi:MAG: hypothetical protein ABIP81_05425 [Terriglobales bacterium]
MRSRRLCCLALAVLASSLPSLSSPLQQKDEDKPTVFTAATEFVQVPVVVQRDGKHLPGLKKNLFTVLQDGKEQPIATFEEVRVQAGTLQKTDFQNTNTPTQNITIIALDTPNTPPLDMTKFRGDFSKYLANAKPNGNIFGLVELTFTGVKVLHDFTDDPRKLHAVIDKKLQ